MASFYVHNEISEKESDNLDNVWRDIWHDIEGGQHSRCSLFCPTKNPARSGAQSDSDEEEGGFDQDLRRPTQVSPGTQEDRLPPRSSPTVRKFVQQDTGDLTEKSKAAVRNKNKRCTQWLSKVHAGVDSIIFLVTSVHGASLCFFLFTLPFLKREHEVYNCSVNDLQVVSSAAIIMLLPISNMVAFATKSGQDRVTRLHHCNPPLLFASAVYELLYHLDVVLSRGGHPTGSNVHAVAT